MQQDKQATPEERRLQRIAQLKAKLQKEEARLNLTKRKERNGQLVAFGVLVEEMFKAGNEAERQALIDAAGKLLKDRTLARALTGFARLKGA